MLEDSADQHKDRSFWLLVVLIIVLLGVVYAVYARHHRPIQPSHLQVLSWPASLPSANRPVAPALFFPSI